MHSGKRQNLKQLGTVLESGVFLFHEYLAGYKIFNTAKWILLLIWFQSIVRWPRALDANPIDNDNTCNGDNASYNRQYTWKFL